MPAAVAPDRRAFMPPEPKRPLPSEIIESAACVLLVQISPGGFPVRLATLDAASPAVRRLIRSAPQLLEGIEECLREL
jgi:hypothetical protein